MFHLLNKTGQIKCLFYYSFSFSSSVYSSDVYEYNGLSEEWTLRPELGLHEGKYRFATTFAKRDNLGCYD